ncbi:MULTISPECIES: SLC13 family permease [unclassified Oceanobacter]|uniref:SLC13 family permease n=1 Tax=unclassified Oceanobacter TaxID=2620260 RepID=UPI0026E26915|nr:MULTISPECIES: SLC13 family permease [unclassified Oceanobacter]MDO6683298.1 SLC13 family permease [Oceanobacter sp. 5_MG-2023]MDP2504098.1 SLC13 family permease [Oceanobacter sp. 3_MG-2023]MDP2610069.1 SLC13 family permease [Oceanobacter sp. 1_MG-2023]MDP2613295.1 SLC13 family permease [Oceanobacter sp. 2_MG-2023]
MLLKHPKYLFLLVMAGLATFVLLSPLDSLDSTQNQTLALVLLIIPLWSTSVIPEFLTALIFFLVVILCDLATPIDVFSGFASTALWLIFAGTVIGMGIKNTGLGDRLARVLQTLLAGSYQRLIIGLVIMSLLLGFLMPSSMGRLVMMLPIVMALASRLGFQPGSPGRSGILIAVAIGSHIPTVSILPANIPNMVLSGAADSLYGIQFGFTDFLLLHFPVLGVAKSALLIAIILWAYPARESNLILAQGHSARTSPSDQAPLTGAQRHMLAIITIALGFWLTDSWHGVNPAWVGLAAAIILLLPRIGLVDAEKFNMNVTMLVFIAGILGIGALINSSGLGQWLGQQLEYAMPMVPGEHFRNYLSLAATAFLSTLPTTQAGTPAMLAPMAQHLADSSGFALETVLMTQVLGYSSIMFPYQSGPLLLTVGMTGESVGRILKVQLPLSLASLLILIPLDYFWWDFLGMFEPL